jgi:hypothetical protein
VIPVDVQVGEHVLHAGWAMELIVEPALLMRGVGGMLHQQSVATYDTLIGLDVTEDGRRCFLRAGWTDLGTVPALDRPLDPARLLKNRAMRGWLRPLCLVWRIGVQIFDLALALLLRARRMRMVPIDAFDERVHAVWDEASRAYGAVCKRDKDYLNWRFIECPDRSRYRCFYCFQGEHLFGYVVLRVSASSSPRRGFIVDFLCAPKMAYWLLASTISFFRREGAAAFYCLTSSPAVLAAGRWLGCLQRDSGWRFMVRAGEKRELLEHPENWFVTSGDSNVDRPRGGTVFAHQHADGSG